MKLHFEVLEFIKIVRRAHPAMPQIYQSGSCWQFYELLNNRFPGECDPYYEVGHIITKIGDRFYDITGEVFPPDDVMPFYGFYSARSEKRVLEQWKQTFCKM